MDRISEITLKDFTSIMQQPLKTSDEGKIMLSLFGSTQEIYINTMVSKLNKLKGTDIYNIKFKVIEQEGCYIIVVLGVGYCSQDEFRATLLSFFLEHITQLI